MCKYIMFFLKQILKSFLLQVSFKMKYNITTEPTEKLYLSHVYAEIKVAL